MIDYSAGDPIGFTWDTILGIVFRFNLGDKAREKTTSVGYEVIERHWSEHTKGKSIRVRYACKDLETSQVKLISEMNLEEW